MLSEDGVLKTVSLLNLVRGKLKAQFITKLHLTAEPKQVSAMDAVSKSSAPVMIEIHNTNIFLKLKPISECYPHLTLQMCLRKKSIAIYRQTVK